MTSTGIIRSYSRRDCAETLLDTFGSEHPTKKLAWLEKKLRISRHYQLADWLTAGIDGFREDISIFKIVAPKMCEYVSSRAMQIFGGTGVLQDTPLGHIWTNSIFFRIADGPDEVHMSQLAKMTMRSLNKQAQT